MVEIGAWCDEQNDLIVNISLWESKEYAIKATAEMYQQFADIPWTEWESKPSKNYLELRRVV